MALKTLEIDSGFGTLKRVVILFANPNIRTYHRDVLKLKRRYEAGKPDAERIDDIYIIDFNSKVTFGFSESKLITTPRDFDMTNVEEFIIVHNEAVGEEVSWLRAHLIKSSLPHKVARLVQGRLDFGYSWE